MLITRALRDTAGELELSPPPVAPTLRRPCCLTTMQDRPLSGQGLVSNRGRLPPERPPKRPPAQASSTHGMLNSPTVAGLGNATAHGRSRTHGSHNTHHQLATLAPTAAHASRSTHHQRATPPAHQRRLRPRTTPPPAGQCDRKPGSPGASKVPLAPRHHRVQPVLAVATALTHRHLALPAPAQWSPATGATGSQSGPPPRDRHHGHAIGTALRHPRPR